MSNREDDKIEVYMTSVAQNIFGDRLSGIVRADSYLRQPDYSARTAYHYYIVLSNGSEREDVLAIRYMRCEFPSCFFNFVYEGELGQYPSHGIWQFSCSPWLFRKAVGKVPMRERDLVDETRQAIFAAYHLSRLYFIRKLDLKTHIWGVRQFGWAVRYARQCLAASLIPPEPGLDAQDIADRDWLIDLQDNWGRYEHAFSNSQDAFRDAAARLSDIAGRRAEALQNVNPAEALMPSKETDPISGIIVPIVRRVHDCLAYEMGPSLLSFYLHGSAARGDMRPDSDIDSFVIVNRVTRQTLDIARKIQADNPPFTISVYGQAEINQYPNFRRYALANGTKLVGGDHRLDFTFNPSDDIAGVINNIFTVRQVIRSYLIEGSYGQRAHYVAGLMAKLIDHGGLRPVQKLVSGSYPTSRAAVRAYFSESTACGRVLDHVDALNSNEQLMRESLFKGFNEPLEDLFFALLQATSWIEARLAV